MADNNIGSLYVDFEADINDFKMALSDVKSEIKDLNITTKRSNSEFAVLAGVTAGLTNFGLNALGQAFSFISSGIGKFLEEQPDVAIATSELNEQFRTMAEDIGPEIGVTIEEFTTLLSSIWDNVGPGVTNLINGLNSILKALNSIEDFELPESLFITEEESRDKASGAYMGGDYITDDGIAVYGGQQTRNSIGMDFTPIGFNENNISLNEFLNNLNQNIQINTTAINNLNGKLNIGE